MTAPSEFAAAAGAYNAAHPGEWPRSDGRCPACGHEGCFGTLPRDPARWFCHSAAHEKDSDRCGRRGSGGWYGDALDLAAHAAGLSRAEVLRREGFLCAPKSNGQPERSARRKIAEWRILDENGRHVATHERWEPGRRGRDKDYLWRQPDGHSGLGGIPAASLPLYGVHDLAAIPPAEPVVVAEGEKAADALRARGIVAVGTVTGAASCPTAASLAVLRGRPVVLWPDNDDTGRLHMTSVGAAILGVASSVRTFIWKDAPPKGDAADWTGTREALRAALASAPEWRASGAGAVPLTEEHEEESQGRPLAFSDPEPWSEPVVLAALLAALRDCFLRYVVFPSAHAVVAVVLWVVHTWTAEEAAEFTPRLIVGGPTKRCGKSRLLEVLAGLVRRALYASGISSAVLFRSIEGFHPTILVDEWDALGEETQAALRGVLNAGQRRDGKYLRCVGDSHEPRAFGVFAAVALCGIGKVPETVADRGIPIVMRRRLKTEKVSRLRLRRFGSEAEPLRRRLARWASDHAAILAQAEPVPPDALDDRAADGWEALLAVADMAGGDWPRLAREAALALSGGRDVADDSTPVLLLRDLAALFRARGVDRLSSADIVKYLGAMEDRPWSEWGRARQPINQHALAALVEYFGAVPRSIRLPGGSTPKGYLLSDFKDAFSRYLPAEVATPPQAASEAGSAAETNRNTALPVADVEALPKPDPGPSGVVAVRERGAAPPVDTAPPRRVLL